MSPAAGVQLVLGAGDGGLFLFLKQGNPAGGEIGLCFPHPEEVVRFFDAEERLAGFSTRPPLRNPGCTQTTLPLTCGEMSISALGLTVPAPYTGMGPAPAVTSPVWAKGIGGGGSVRAGSGASETRKSSQAHGNRDYGAGYNKAANAGHGVYSVEVSREGGGAAGAASLWRTASPSSAVQAPPSARCRARRA